MKTLRISLLALLGLATLGAVRAVDTAPAPRVEVNFDKPEKFADAGSSQRGSDFGRDANLAEFKSHLELRANTYIPEGQKLVVTFTDIDLAGEVEPWRSPQHQDIRIVKDIYTPKIDLSFKLLDAKGAVLKEGARHLSNLNFLMELYPNRNEPLVYDKALLDTWLRDEFVKPKARK